MSDSIIDTPEPEPDDDELWELHRADIEHERRENEFHAEQQRLDRLAGIALSAIGVLRDILHNEHCELDRHGHCRRHDWMQRNVPCPYERGQELLRRLDN